MFVKRQQSLTPSLQFVAFSPLNFFCLCGYGTFIQPFPVVMCRPVYSRVSCQVSETHQLSLVLQVMNAIREAFFAAYSFRPRASL
jgi:hypothetical protein